MSSRIAFILKTLFIASLLLAGYYLFFLKPKLELPNKLLLTEKILSSHHSNLLQNRLSYVELTRIDPETPAVDLEKSNLMGIIKKTNQEGLEALNKKENLPNVDPKLSQRFPELLKAEKEIFERQGSLLEKLFAQKTYADGIKILKGEESIKLLTDQTNLTLEYQFWLEKINKLQGEE